MLDRGLDQGGVDAALSMFRAERVERVHAVRSALAAGRYDELEEVKLATVEDALRADLAECDRFGVPDVGMDFFG